MRWAVQIGFSTTRSATSTTCARGANHGRRRVIRPVRHGSRSGLAGYNDAPTRALIHEGLDRASIGFTNRSHRLRKSLGGDLAHSGAVSKYHRSRLLGHKVPRGLGAQVTIDHYTPPNLRDLTPYIGAMDAIDRLICEAMPEGLLQGTNARVLAGPRAGMPEQQAHAREVIAVALAERPPPEQCSFHEAAALLDLPVRQVRRLAEQGHLEVTTTTTPTGRPARTVTRRSVATYARQLADTCTLVEAAELTGLAYATLYQRARRGTLVVVQEPGDRVPRLAWADVKLLLEEVALRAELDERSLTIPAAGCSIRRHPTFVERLLAIGQIEADPAAGWAGFTYVTRASVAAYQTRHGKDPDRVWAERTRVAQLRAPRRPGDAEAEA